MSPHRSTDGHVSRPPIFTARAFRLRLRFSHTLSFQRTTSASINPLPHGIHFTVMFSALLLLLQQSVFADAGQDVMQTLSFTFWKCKTVRLPQWFVSGILGTEK
jgi:hypothetical protein